MTSRERIADLARNALYTLFTILDEKF